MVNQPQRDTLTNDDVDQFVTNHAPSKAAELVDSTDDEPEHRVTPDDYYRDVDGETLIDTRELTPMTTLGDNEDGHVTTILKGEDQYCRYERVIVNADTLPAFIYPGNWEEWMEQYTGETPAFLGGAFISLSTPLSFLLFVVGMVNAFLLNVASAMGQLIAASGTALLCLAAGRFFHWMIRLGLSEGAANSKECELMTEQDVRTYLAEHDREAYREHFGELPRP